MEVKADGKVEKWEVEKNNNDLEVGKKMVLEKKKKKSKAGKVG